MTSNVDRAWADMKSPKAAKYASRVKQVLSGSVNQGRKAKALGSSALTLNQVRATRHDEPTGKREQERILSTGTTNLARTIRGAPGRCMWCTSDIISIVNPEDSSCMYHLAEAVSHGGAQVAHDVEQM